MPRVLLTAGLLCWMNVMAFGQTISEAPRVAFPESPSPAPLNLSEPSTAAMPELVLPSEPGPYVEGPRPTPIRVDLTYADRVNLTTVAQHEGPAGPTDSSSVAWPSVASANGTVLMAVQSRYRVTDRCGNTLLEEPIAARVSTTGTLSAPSVIYSPWVDRWAMLWLETDLGAQVSNYILMVTTGPGNFDVAPSVYYRIPARTGSGADLAFADAPRLGYGPRGLMIASDQYRFTGFTYTGTQTLTIENVVFQAGAATYRTDFFASSENLLGIYPAKMQATTGNLDAIFVATRRAGGSDVWMWRIEDAFGTRSGTPTTMPVPAYAIPPAVAQPEGRTFTRGVDCRLRSAVATIDGSTLKLHIVHNTARADPTQQAMMFAHRIVVSTAIVDESAFYVYGGEPNFAMFAPTLAVGYDGTRAIAYTLSTPDAAPRPMLLVSNPSLSFFLTQMQGSIGVRNATAFGYGIGLELDWNDFARYGTTDARRFVALGQYCNGDPQQTPTWFTSVQNAPSGNLTYLGATPLVFRKPPGATHFTPASYNVRIGNTYETQMGVEMGSSFGLLDFSTTSFSLERLTDSRVVQVRASAAADTLPLGRWSDRLAIAPCGLSRQHNITAYFLVGCIADVDDGSGFGNPDGGVTIDDLLFFLTQFSIGSLRADVDDGTTSGVPDGGVTIDDLLYFLDRFDQGC